MNKKRVSIVLAVMCAVMLVVGSLALFTDSFQSSVSATAGTLDLNLSTISTTIKPSGATSIKPGQAVKFDYTLSNNGNKSADVRETLVITFAPKAGSTATINSATPEFVLYEASNVNIDNTTGIATVIDPTKALTTVTSGTKLTYSVPEFILNGKVGANGREVETDATACDVKTGSYVLVFSSGVSNDFQGATLTLHYDAQAKQHRNTNADTWDAISSTVTFAGDTAFKAVPAN